MQTAGPSNSKELRNDIDIVDAIVNFDAQKLPGCYQEYLPAIRQAALLATNKKSMFDICVYTGRSGYAAALVFQAAGIETIELPPLPGRHAPGTEDLRPPVPCTPELLRSRLAGMRVLFIDDQVGSQETLQSVRKSLKEYGAQALLVHLYRYKYPGETLQFLYSNETDLLTSSNGTKSNVRKL